MPVPPFRTRRPAAPPWQHGARQPIPALPPPREHSGVTVTHPSHRGKKTQGLPKARIPSRELQILRPRRPRWKRGGARLDLEPAHTLARTTEVGLELLAAVLELRDPPGEASIHLAVHLHQGVGDRHERLAEA